MSFNKKTWLPDYDLTEKEMNDLENRVEREFLVNYSKIKEQNELNSTTHMSSGAGGYSSPSYPKPLVGENIPSNAFVKAFWVITDANSKIFSRGNADIIYYQGTPSIVHQEVIGTYQVKLGIASDGKTLQFNQNSGYWNRIFWQFSWNK